MSEASHGRGRQQQNEEPQCLKVFDLLLWLLKVVLSLPGAPLYLLMTLTQSAVAKGGLYPAGSVTGDRIRSYIFVLWIPRFIVAALVVIVGIGQVAGVCYIIGNKLSATLWWQYGVMIIGQILLYIIGFIFIPRLITCLKMRAGTMEWILGVVYAVCDLATFFVACIIMLTFVRAKSLWHIGNVTHGDIHLTWRRFVFRQTIMVVIDVLLLPFLLMLLVSWRRNRVCRELDRLKASEGDQRLMILEQWVKLLVDIPFYMLMILLIPMPHRLFMALRDVYTVLGRVGDDDDDGNNNNGGNGNGAARRDVGRASPHWNARRTILVQLCLAIMDPFVAMARLLLAITYYRHQRVQKRINDESDGFFCRDPILLPAGTPVKGHRLTASFIVLYELFDLLADIPFIILAIPVVLSVWRTKYFVRMFFAQRLDENGVAQSVHHPHIVSQRRYLVVQQLMGLFIDMIVIIICIPLWCTLYRVPSVISKIIEREKETDSNGNGNGNGNNAVGLLRVPTPNIDHRRSIMLYATLSVIIDIPFILMSVVMMPLIWRPCLLLRDLLQHSSARNRRRAVVQQLLMAIMDIPALLCVIIITLTGYRAGRLWRKLRDINVARPWSSWPYIPYDVTHEARTAMVTAAGHESYCCCSYGLVDHNGVTRSRLDCHIICFTEALSLLCDIPFGIMATIVMCTLFRSVELWRNFRAHTTISARRRECWQQFISLVIDIPFIMLFIIVAIVAFPWMRGPRLIYDMWQSYWPTSPLPLPPAGAAAAVAAGGGAAFTWTASHRRIMVLQHLFLAILDFPTLLMGAIIAGSIWRAPSTYTEVRDHSMGFFPRYNPLTRQCCGGGHHDDFVRPHIIIWTNFISLLIDIPFVMMGMIPAISIWRSACLYDDMMMRLPGRALPPNGSISSRRRRAALEHFCLLIIDIILAVPFLLALCSGLRTRKLLSRVQQEVYSPTLSWSWICRSPTPHAPHHGAPVAAAVIAPPILPAPSSVPLPLPSAPPGGAEVIDGDAPPPPYVPPTPVGDDNVVAAAIPVAVDPNANIGAGGHHVAPLPLPMNDINDIGVHQIVLAEFFALLLDLPIVPLYFILVIIPWRSRVFRANIAAARDHSDGDRRLLVLHRFALLLADIPCAIMFIIIMATIWRIHPLLTVMRRILSREQQHQAEAHHALPDGTPSVVIPSQQHQHQPQQQQQQATVSLSRAWDVVFGTTLSLHIAICTQSIWLVIQLPLVIMCYILTFSWRIHHVCTRILPMPTSDSDDDDHNAQRRVRGAAAPNRSSRNLQLLFAFFLYFIDIPTLIVGAMVSVTWRGPRMWKLLPYVALPRDTLTINNGSNANDGNGNGNSKGGMVTEYQPVPTGRYHYIVWNELRGVLIDIPFACAALIASCTLLRIPLVYRVLLRMPRDARSRENWAGGIWAGMLSAEVRQARLLRADARAKKKGTPKCTSTNGTNSSIGSVSSPTIAAMPITSPTSSTITITSTSPSTDIKATKASSPSSVSSAKPSSPSSVSSSLQEHLLPLRGEMSERERRNAKVLANPTYRNAPADSLERQLYDEALDEARASQRLQRMLMIAETNGWNNWQLYMDREMERDWYKRWLLLRQLYLALLDIILVICSLFLLLLPWRLKPLYRAWRLRYYSVINRPPTRGRRMSRAVSVALAVNHRAHGYSMGPRTLALQRSSRVSDAHGSSVAASGSVGGNGSGNGHSNNSHDNQIHVASDGYGDGFDMNEYDQMIVEESYDSYAYDDFNERDFALYPRSQFRHNLHVEDESVEIFVEFIELLRDIPYVIATIIMIPFVWRFQSLMRELWLTRTNEPCCPCDDLDDDDNDHGDDDGAHKNQRSAPQAVRSLPNEEKRALERKTNAHSHTHTNGNGNGISNSKGTSKGSNGVTALPSSLVDQILEKEEQKRSVSELRRHVVIAEWIELLIDIPYVILGLILFFGPVSFACIWLVTMSPWYKSYLTGIQVVLLFIFAIPYRAIFLLIDLFHNTCHTHHRAHHRRRTVLMHTIMYFADWPAIISGIIVVSTWYRVARIWRARHRHNEVRYINAAYRRLNAHRRIARGESIDHDTPPPSNKSSIGSKPLLPSVPPSPQRPLLSDQSSSVPPPAENPELSSPPLPSTGQDSATNEQKLAPPTDTATTPIVTSVSTGNVGGKGDTRLAIARYNQGNASDDMIGICDDISQHLSTHVACWREMIMIIIDIPCFIMAFLPLLSLWRTSAIIDEWRQSRVDERNQWLEHEALKRSHGNDHTAAANKSATIAAELRRLERAAVAGDNTLDAPLVSYDDRLAALNSSPPLSDDDEESANVRQSCCCATHRDGNGNVAAVAYVGPRHHHDCVAKIGWTQRSIMVSQFVSLLVDIPAIIAAMIVTACVYRAPGLWRQLRGVHVDERRAICARELAYLLFDIPFIILAVILLPLSAPVLFTRWLLLCRDIIWYTNNGHERRLATLYQFGLFFADIPALFAFGVITLTIYRLPRLIRELFEPATTSPWSRYVHHGPSRLDWHILTFTQVILLIVDIPFAVMTIIIMATGWRAPTLASRLLAHAPSCQQLSAACSCDIRHRLKRLVRGANHGHGHGHDNDNDEEKNSKASATCSLLKVPDAVISSHLFPCLDDQTMALFGSVHRDIHRLELHKKLWRTRYHTTFAEHMTSSATSMVHDRNVRIADTYIDGTAWKSMFAERYIQSKPSSYAALRDLERGWLLRGYRRIIWQQFVQWFIDLWFIPLFIILVATLLRTIPLIRDFMAHSQGHIRRRIIWSQLDHLLCDIVCIPMMIILCITLYRAPLTFARLAALPRHQYSVFSLMDDNGSEAYKLVVYAFGGLLTDIPFNILGLLSLYRIPLIWSDMTTSIPRRYFGNGDHRWICAHHFLQTIYDIPFIFMTILTLIAPWRTLIIWKKYQYQRDTIRFDANGAAGGVPASFVRRLVAMNFLVIPIDYIGIAFSLFIICTVWRAPTYVQMLRRGRGFKKSVALSLLAIGHDIMMVGILIPIIIIGIQRLPGYIGLVISLIRMYGDRHRHEAWLASDDGRAVVAQEARAHDNGDDDDTQYHQHQTILHFGRALHCHRTADGFGFYHKKLGFDDYAYHVLNPNRRPAPSSSADAPITMATPAGDAHDHGDAANNGNDAHMADSSLPSSISLPTVAAMPLSPMNGNEMKRHESLQPGSSSNDSSPGSAVPSTVIAVNDVTALSSSPPPSAPAHGRPKKLDLDNIMGGRAAKYYNRDMPWSLSFLRQLTRNEAILSITRFHHVLLTPFRLIAYCMSPLFYWIRYRRRQLDRFNNNGNRANNGHGGNGEYDEEKGQMNGNGNGENGKGLVVRDVITNPELVASSEPGNGNGSGSDTPGLFTMSYLFDMVTWLYKRCPEPRLQLQQFKRMERFLVINILIIGPLVANEVAVLMMMIFGALIEIVSLHHHAPMNINNMEYHRTRSCGQTMLLTMSILLQGITLWPLAAIVIASLFIPLAMAYVINQSLSSFTLSLLFTSATWPWWIVSVCWWVIIMASLQLLYRYTKYVHMGYRPYALYGIIIRSMIDTVMARGLVWRMYRSIMAGATQCCWKIRQGCWRWFGELNLMICGIIWCLWPVAIPILAHNYLFLILTIPIAFLFILRVRKIVTQNWTDFPTTDEEEERSAAAAAATAAAAAQAQAAAVAADEKRQADQRARFAATQAAAARDHDNKHNHLPIATPVPRVAAATATPVAASAARTGTGHGISMSASQRQQAATQRMNAARQPPWTCSACTFINPSSRVSCSMCDTPRS